MNSLRGLSPREQEILQSLVTGASNKLIAIKLGITEATVKVHLKTLLRKIDVNNRTQAAIWAINNGFTASDNRRQPVTFTRFQPDWAGERGAGFPAADD